MREARLFHFDEDNDLVVMMCGPSCREGQALEALSHYVQRRTAVVPCPEGWVVRSYVVPDAAQREATAEAASTGGEVKHTSYWHSDGLDNKAQGRLEPGPESATIPLTGQWLTGYGGDLRVYRGLLLRVLSDIAWVLNLDGQRVAESERWTHDEYHENGGVEWAHGQAEQAADEYLAREGLAEQHPRDTGPHQSPRRTRVHIDLVLREKPRAADWEFIPYSQRRVLEALQGGAVPLSGVADSLALVQLVARGLVHVYQVNNVAMVCRVEQRARS